MELSSDPYELKLYQMFQSCDKEQCGLLDEESLRRLCGLLELQDKGAVLIADLSGNGRVSFDCFKEALLNFLGAELELDTKEQYKKGDTYKRSSDVISAATIINSSNSNSNCLADTKERTLVICDTNEGTKPVESDHAVSDREVSPKLVMGSKKYGRRSRPTGHKTKNISLTDSDDDIESNDHRSCEINVHNCLSSVQRSSSQTDIPNKGRRRPPTTNGGGKLKRCSSLPTQRSMQHKINSKSLSSSIQKADLWDKRQPRQVLSSSMESLESPPLTEPETLPVHRILDIFEGAEIANGRGILLALGFDDDEVNVAQLNKVLEEELRGLDDDTQLALVRAYMALQASEMTALRQNVRQLHDENKKLHSSNKDANQRLALLAAEIDERHASLEDTSKKEVRLLEQRHATLVRELSTRMANDRENWSSFTTRLEARIKQLEQEEIRNKTELELVRKENCELESEHQKMQKQITELLEKNVQLNLQLADLDRDTSTDVRENRNDKRVDEDEEVARLVEKVSELQVDNKNLRDKTDELVAEIESLNLELLRTKSKNKKSISNTNSSTTLDVGSVALDDAEQAANLTATKRRGDSPSKTHITEESPRLGKLRKCTDTAGSEASDTSGEWMALNSELRESETHANSATDNVKDYLEQISTLKQKIAELEAQQKTPAPSSEGISTDERCKELEASLEQMQRAYEDCEDYWQSKLAEERQLFEKERQIYEEEQQESDKKFTELMEKVREYEEQFSRDGRLSPIEEKDALEQQYADLEAEANDLRETARKMFDEKCNEIENLQREIEDLRTRLGESVEILTGACELNNEAMAVSALHINPDKQSPASSPISYLWHQSTIQEPAKSYNTVFPPSPESPTRQANRNNLTTSETTIFSTTPVDTIAPIQKPPGSNSKQSESETDEVSSTASGKSSESHSPASTHSARQSQQQQLKKSPSTENSISSLGMKEELKRLKFFEISLREQVKNLSLQRDGLVMELQQLQEARPVLEKAYARTPHPSVIQRVNQLELRNRHLQNAIKQQQQQTESLMQRSWQQHQMELADLHNRIETQGSMLAEQVQRLQNADMLVKDLYVENAHLAATVQRLEQHRARMNMMHQQRQGLNGLPGMP
ncbi:PREDICTED: blastoderm-specific protein 25D isoform X2 [Bactrocera latifrons]|uniref:Blastoderm-specific protein 25D n=1 Tax=Bactrocera latifrons TaxID=174628 RepID=A0A0K8UWY4_BACLA|nr:PREDICTED: blastoderm-specific protein 25D isoform X2 [Bactrocera latifrons]